MFSFSPAIKLEALGTPGEVSLTKTEAEPESSAPCHPLLGSSLFHTLLTSHQQGGGVVGIDDGIAGASEADYHPLAMLRRLGWDAAGGGELSDSNCGLAASGRSAGGVEVNHQLTETLAVTAERLHADYLQYCLAKESARLFYSRLAVLQQPFTSHHRYT
jgi:hypothetical protein